MSTFDAWIKKHHPELLTEFGKLPKAKRKQTFYTWVKENHPSVIHKEWPAAAQIAGICIRREAGADKSNTSTW